MMRTMAVLMSVMLTSGAAAEEVRRDLYGDPLPKGALMRLGTVRFRHGGELVMGIAYSPDGKLLASCGRDNLIRLWDARTGEELRRLIGHEDYPTHIAFSPDCKRLASTAADDTVRLWDVHTGKLLHTIEEEELLYSLVFSGDGKRVAAGSGDKRIYLWDAVTGKCLRTLEGHDGIFLSPSPDGKLLASAGLKDGTIRLWDMATGKLVRECGPRKGKVYPVQFAPDGKTLATCGEDGSIHLWDAATGKEVRRWKVPEGKVYWLAFTANGKRLLSGGGEEDIRVREWDPATGKELRVLSLPLDIEPEFTPHLSLSPDGKTLASVSLGNAVRRWDLASGKEVLVPRGHEAAIHSLRFANKDKTLLSTAEDGTAILWDVATGKELQAEEETVRLRKRISEKVLESFALPAPVSLRFSPDGKFLVAEADQIIHLWDVAAGKERCRMVGRGPLVFSADSRFLAVPDAFPEHKAGGGMPLAKPTVGGIHVWELDVGKEVRYLPHPDGSSDLSPLCFSPDGRMLAVWLRKAERGGTLMVWEVATGKERLRLCRDGNTILAAAFSPDGATLAAGGMEQKVRLWDMRSGKEGPCFRGDQGEVRSLAFSKDGRQLASGGKNTTVLLWPITAPPRTQTPPDKDLSPRELQALWTDLCGLDAARAFRSMRTLYAHPPSTAAFLRQQLRPAETVDAETARRLLAELESDESAIRERATKELVKLGDAAELLLRRALRHKPSLELRRRAERLLNELATETPERLRTRRAVEVLEWQDTTESRRLLEELAGGAADVWLTREAKAARERRAAR